MTLTRARLRTPWTVELVRRLKTLWMVKMFGTTAGISAFMTVYFWLLHNPLYPASVMPVTAIDHAIGFHPVALPLYLSLWLYVSLAPALAKEGEDIACYSLAALFMSVIGLGTFLLWPTTIPVFAIDWSQHAGMAFLKDHDLAANSFPSMHVAFAVFSAMVTDRHLRRMDTARAIMVLNWLWCAGILYSTLATAQHVLVDLLGGAGLGLAGGMLYFWLLRRCLRRKPEPDAALTI